MEKKIFSRRNILKNIGLLAPIIVACKSTAGKKTNNNQNIVETKSQKKMIPSFAKSPETAVVPPLDVSAELPKVQTPEAKMDNTPCDFTERIDLSQIRPITEEYFPLMKCYGSPGSVLVVIAFPKFQQGIMDAIFLVKNDGTLIIQKSIEYESDVNYNKTMKLQIFDSINLKADDKLVLLIKENSGDAGKYYKYEFPESWFNLQPTFRDKPVQSQSITNISKDYSTFAPNPIFISTLTDTAMTSTFVQGRFSLSLQSKDDLRGIIITDLMGITLFEHGEYLDDLFLHPYVVLYQLSGYIYYQTLVRLS